MEAKITITVIVAIVAAAVIFFIFKAVRHWGERTDRIMDSISDMGNRMENIERGVDNIRITTEKLIQETQETGRALQELQERSVKMLAEKSAVNEEESERKNRIEIAEFRAEEKKNEDILETIRNAEKLSEEVNGDLKNQVEDLEKELLELKKQKEKLEFDINARIRD